MDSGELDAANPAITDLRWLDQSDKTLLFIPSVTSGQQQEDLNSIQRHWPILLGALIAVLFILAALLLRRKRKRFVKLRDLDRFRNNLSDIESVSANPWEIHDGRLTDEKQSEGKDYAQQQLSDRNLDDTNQSVMTDHQEDFLGFLEERKRSANDWLIEDDTSYGTEDEELDYLKKSQSFSGLGSEMVHLRHIDPILKARSVDSAVANSPMFTVDDSGRIFDPSLICSICNKSMEGMARKFCACGNDSCNISAHMLCVLEKYPLPSVSHPGTPPTMLPIRLCRYRPKA